LPIVFANWSIFAP